MARKQRAALLPSNLILLQNLVKRDPESYREEFLQQYSHYESLRDILMENTSEEENDSNEELKELIGFLTAVCSCYKEETKEFPLEIKTLLATKHRDLSPSLREKIIQSLVMLRNRDIITAESLIQTIFPLLSEYSSTNNTVETNSKALRKQIYTTLVGLLKSVNTGTNASRLNKVVQNMFLSDLNKDNGLFITKITIRLWYSRVWTDSRTVEILAQATLNGDPKVAIASVRFFLGSDKELYEGKEEDSDEEIDLSQMKHNLKVNKKTGKRYKKMGLAVKSIKRKQNKDGSKNTVLNFTAVQLLRDPQGFAEQLFKQLTSRKFTTEHKITFMNLISRVVGVNKLQLLQLYSYFLKYLTPKQIDVTKVLAAVVQASHDLVPPDVLLTVIRKIADEFVSDGVSAEVCSTGINTIREVLSRAPLAITPELLQDLTAYNKSKAKAVGMAAKSLISLYREVAPEMLERKDRGKEASMLLQSGKDKGLQYGVESTVLGIPGIELLDKWREKQGMAVDDQDYDEQAWEVDEEVDEEDIDGEWVNVESDKEYDISTDEEDDKEEKEDKDDSDLDLSDEETEKPKTISKKAKKKKRELMEEETKKMEGDSEESFKKLASGRILTPADFAKLAELKMEAGVLKALGVRNTLQNEEEVDADGLIGSVKRKQTKEERIEKIKEGREGRDKFGSRRGKLETPHSTTNREKARKKNFIMMIHKRQVQGKARRSLRDKQKVLQAHITLQKKKGH